MLYAALPQEFTKQMVMEQAEKLNIPVNTARSWIQRLREKGALDMVMVKGKGVYSKNKGNKENTRTCIYNVRARV